MRRRGKRLLVAGLAAVLAVTNSGLSVFAAETNEEAKAIHSPVLITEMIPNTVNAGDLDAYEYYELTNISDKEIDLTDYNIVYVNGSKMTLWNPDITRLPAGESMLVWIRNSDNGSKTKADFCEYYRIPEDSLVAEVECDGLSNSGPRTLALATATGKVLFSAACKSL